MQRLLIANRGEIACRIIRTARALHIETVAVYSEADRQALHVELADHAVAIGGASPADSYLNIDAILEAAKRTNADAVHPGYGFLSENAGFARACEDLGLIFVGPPVAAIEAMGSKAAAKTIMQDAGVPLLPGFHGDQPSAGALKQAAEEIGYPVLLKASAGGGGKGMRIVAKPGDFDAALAAAQREARNAFGDEQMLVEKYLTAPRHIEVQVFADRHGQTIHLFDRDCSIQRRHQKIVEEAPAPGIDTALRQRMGEAAVAAARAIDYVGAGTVEFLLDGEQFYFMEMNTRLQVEHPVSELITGVDLVQWQLAVADGEPLPCAQDALSVTGHAIECRIYAEDADNDFLPTSGRIDALRWPPRDDTVRVDSGVRSGDEISVFYDPMIAKLIVHAADRSAAIRSMRDALSQTQIVGLTHNVDFLLRIVNSPAFAASAPVTRFIEQQSEALAPLAPETIDWIAAAIAWQQHRVTADTSVWQQFPGWRANQPNIVHVALAYGDEKRSLALRFDQSRIAEAQIDNRVIALACEIDGSTLVLEIDGIRSKRELLTTDHAVLVSSPSGHHRFAPLLADLGAAQDSVSDGQLRAPMSGRVASVAVAEGDAVAAGQTVLVLEAMKMEHSLRAPFDGRIETLPVSVGDLVAGQQLLLSITPLNEEIPDA